MYEILDETLEQLEAALPFALVTLVADQGSTPRGAGAEMLVREDGSIAGTVGGGLIEHHLMQAAAEALGERSSRRVSIDLHGRDVTSADKMVCGGAADALVTYVPPADADLLAVCRGLKAAREAGRRAWYVTVLPDDPDADAPASAGKPVAHCLLAGDDAVTGAPVCGASELRRLTGAAALHGTARLPDGRDAVIERVDPPARAVVCGAGHVGRAVTPLLTGLGFRVCVIDDREEFASPDRFPDADVRVLPYSGALAAVGADEHTYVVVVTRGHVHDLDVLQQALRLRARYVGVMGSRTKRARMREALREAGFSEADIARVHSPIGLAIGAQTPAELAVSIAAEVVHVRAETGG